MTTERQSLQATDGHRILLDLWRPAKPAALIHLFHGLAEHPARYERFAEHCNAEGFAVAAHSHRGHGENCKGDELGHYADQNGWDKTISDAALVHDSLIRKMPDIPLVLLGHSMGSYIAQSFLMRGEGRVSALVLSAGTYPSRVQVRIGHWLAAIESMRKGKRSKSALLNNLGLGEFNKPFAPNRTAFDWLSRDESEVDKYVSDPLCGADSSSGLWYNLTGGLLEVSTAKALRKIPPELPVLITGGSDDPAGGEVGLGRLARKYRESGHSNTTLKIYADARHEMFNETNREEFYRDLTQWMTGAVLTRNA